MRVYLDTFVALLLLFSSTTTLAHPQPITDIQLMPREQAEALDARNGVFGDISTLWKRKGGGGGGGKGGGGGGGGSGGSSSGGSSSGGSGYVGSSSVGSRGSSPGNLVSTPPSTYGGGGSGHGNSGSRSSGKGSSSSNSGGATKTGSGVTPNYGGGRYYGGGSTSPYASGGRSPAGIVAVPLLVGAGALALYPGYHLYPYGAYAYPYYHPYGFYNRTGRRNATNSTTNTRREVDFEMIQIRQTTTTGINETKPVTCLCAMYAVCGCDDNGNKTFLDSLIGDGTYANLNLSLVDVADINGTSTIVINGTLPNGTTAAGGTEDAFGAATALTQASGYWVMIALVAATVCMV